MTGLNWWQKAVFYQIYPRSFADGNGDGIGDIAGMIGKLDYLRDLGIDAIWLSPHFPSPLFDCGYDVADYTGVAPEYGTLGDFKRFLDAAHKRGIRIILDFVLNHTSHEHPWFIESRSSKTNPKRDWYIWRDGRGSEPPNNWMSVFGGPAWEFDPTTGQSYYHFFFKEQPDLNWRNSEVKKAMFDAARFWLKLGVDGFRLDAIGTLFENPTMPDHAAKISQSELHRRGRLARTGKEKKILGSQWHAMFKHQLDQPGVHELMRELRSVADEFPDRVLVGETDDIEYHGNGRNELHMVFNFPLMKTPRPNDHRSGAARLTPKWIRANQKARLAKLPQGAWPCNTLGNHDSPRVYNRYADGKHNDALARLSIALMLTLRGTPFLYNGEEIGMSDLMLDDIRRFKDMMGVWLYHLEVDQLGTSQREALKRAAEFGRDKCRTPMQWSNAPNAGFCPAGISPWLPVHPNYARGINVANQLDNPASLLNFYRRLIHLRKQTPALQTGEYQPLLQKSPDVLSFLRIGKDARQTCLVVLNMSGRRRTLRLQLRGRTLQQLFSSHLRIGIEDNPVKFPAGPFEIYIGELKNRSTAAARMSR